MPANRGSAILRALPAKTTGAQGICMHILRIPPGGRAKAHLHESHETAIYVMEGSAAMYWGGKA